MKRALLLTAVVVSVVQLAWSQTDKAWSTVADKNFTINEHVRRQSFPQEFKIFKFSPQILREVLANAPQRFGSRTNGAVISIPNADGGIERFEMFEASNFAPALQAAFPEIRSYVGRGLDDKNALLRMSVDPSGIQTMVFRTGKRNEFMEPYSADGTVYAVYNSSRNKGELPFVCSTDDVSLANSLEKQAAPQSRLSNSGELLTFRLALSCNAEYTNYFGGISGALAAFNATMTRVNGVFEKDLAIHMNIIANTNLVIYTNASTDPYTTMGQWNGQLQSTLNSVIGNANYDIGHMFGKTGGGGNAGCIGCVCVTNQKGRGITSPADGVPMGDNFDIDYVAHEMGHQFGGNHTFSNDVEGSGVNVEPGSGSTIMGYAGITAQDIAAHSDDYFVYASIKQIQDNMIGKTCPVRTPLSNVAPVMNAGPDYIIPKSTPFILTGSGTDADGDSLTYCWEENDSATSQVGFNSQASPTKTGGPNWRSYDPTESTSRFCPPLARVVANQLTTTFGSIKSEAVSSVARELNFVLTGRDQILGVGQTNTDAMKVTVTAAAGPFLVSAPNTAVSWQAGSNQTVSWSVAGTTANGVDAQYVDIFLSTDGGLTFATQLASQVPNDGSETVTMPNIAGSANRIMVKGYNHIFYDISNTNFSLTAPPSTFSIAFSGVPGEQNKSACKGSSVVYTIPYVALGGFSGTTSFSVSGQPAGATTAFSSDSANATGNITLTIGDTNSSAAGFYNIIVTGISGPDVKTVPLYLQLFNSDFETPNLTSPANASTGQSISPTLTWDADANATMYDVELATDGSFATIIASATVSGNSYFVSGLAEATTYYWRVLPKNSSCGGSFSAASVFQTGQIACDNFASDDVPVTISANGADTVSSTLTIGDPAVISGISVNVDITHSWVNDISATLISPSGIEVPLFVNPCSSANLQNINATFDDAGAVMTCGFNPAISGTIQPSSPLSALIGQDAAGDWTLVVEDDYDQDGGSVNAWSLNICTTQPLGIQQHDSLDFAVYPNPNNGSFNVQFNASTDNTTISVHDIRGRKIFEKTYTGNGIFSQSLQLNDAGAGVYLVSVQSGSRKEVRKVVVR